MIFVRFPDPVEDLCMKQFWSVFLDGFWRILQKFILVPRVRRFLVTWKGNEGLWTQPLPDVRKFLTSGRACVEDKYNTAHAQK